MKVGAVLLVVLVGGAALAGTIWISQQGTLSTKDTTQDAAAKPAPDKDEFTPPEISPTGPYPKAVVEDKEFDFDVMAVGETGKHTFVIRNDGEAPLVVKKGVTTCKCTLSAIPDGQLQPGESVEVEVEWAPPGPSDQFRQVANIMTNDPENKVLELVVKGRVDEIVKLSPPGVWNLGEVDDEEPIDLEGSLTSAVLDEFKIESIETSDPLLKIETEPLDEEALKEAKAKAGYALKLRLEPGIAVGSINETLTIKTDVKGGTTLSMNVKGSRSGPVRIIPSPGVVWHANAMAVDLGEFDGSDGKKATLSMFVTGLEGDQELEFLEVNSDSEFVKVSLEPDPSFKGKDRKRYMLRFEVVPGTPVMTKVLKSAAKVRVKTSHPQAEEMKFYVQFVTL